MKLASLSNEELVARLHAGESTTQGICDTYNEVMARLRDGRAVLAEPGEELSGVNTECPCCGEEFRALANGFTTNAY
jgi:hypothetical protein